MENEINSLTLNIKNLIKDFSQGKLSAESTEQQLLDLEKQYQILKNNISENSNINDNYLDGICYYHNIENFCIFSAFYYYSKKNFKLLSSYGDNFFHKKLVYILQKNILKIKENEIFEINSKSEKSLNNNLYIKVKKNNDGQILIFAALSSSKFFNKEKFDFIYDFIIKLLPEFKFSQFSYLDKLKNIEKQINIGIEQNKELYAYIFYFEDLLSIFGHMGKFNLEKIIKIIMDTININFKNSFISCLSHSDYVVLSKDEKYDENKIKSKLNFTYKEIPIPYILKSVKLTDNNDYLKFTETLFSISD